METNPQTTPKQVKRVPGRHITERSERDARMREQVLCMFLEGTGAVEIARKLKINGDRCRAIINRAKLELQRLDAAGVRSLLGSLWYRVLKHNERSSRELVLQWIKAEREREVATKEKDIKTVTACDTAIRKLISEVQVQDKAIMDTLTRVGVPRMLDDEDDGSHTPSSILIDYDQVGAEDAEISLLEDRVKKLKRLRGKK